MNNPAERGTKISEIPSTYVLRRKTTHNPINAVNAVKKLYNNAFFLENPPWTNTQKSPIS